MDRKIDNFDNKENLGHGIKGEANNAELKNDARKKNSQTKNDRNNMDELL